MNWWPWSKKQHSYGINLENLQGYLGNISGGSISVEQALGVVAVLACARKIANGLSQVPLKRMRPTPNGGWEHAKEGRTGKILYRTANEYQTAFSFRQMMGMHLVLVGDFFAYKQEITGEVTELLPLPVGHVTTGDDMWRPEYKVRFKADSQPVHVPANKILHIRGPSLHGTRGLDVVKLAASAIGLSKDATAHAGRLFKGGAAVGGLFTTDENLRDQQRKDLLDVLREQENDAHNGAYKNMLLWGGLKFQHRSYAPEQAQLMQIRNQQIEEIARAFDVNPIMIGYTGDKTPTYASAEQLFVSHVVHSLGPWYTCIEQELYRQMLNDEQRDNDWDYKHIVQGLMRGSHKDRAEYYTKRYSVGSISPNEIRKLEDENPYPGGDEYRVPMNTENVNVGNP